MGSRVLAPVAAAAVVSVPLLLTIGSVEAQSRCYLGGHLHNRDRQIGKGAVLDAECPGFTLHAAPFGNWGVFSRFSAIKDDMGLLLEGTVMGTVVDASGDAVQGATVHAKYESFEGAQFLASFIGGFTLTRPDGQFHVRGIVPNEHFILYAEFDGRRSDSMRLQATPGVPLQDVILRVE